MLSFQQIILIVLSILNIISFIFVYWDKQKSINHEERTPEVDFFIWSIFFSSLGILVGMFVFHHKTRKLKFVLGIGLLLIQQAALAYLITLNFV